MGVQVPCSFYPEMSAQGFVRRIAQALGRSIPETGGAERMPDRGGASSGRPRTHDDLDSPEVRSVVGGWVHQGQERDPPGTGVRGTQAELCWAKLLGAWVFRVNGW